MDSYEPSGKEILGNIFSREYVRGLYNDAIDFGKGFGTGLWYTLQFPYNVPTQLRKREENGSLVQKGRQKKEKMMDKWDEIIEGNVSDEYKMGVPVTKTSDAWEGGIRAGAGIGVSVGILEGLAYGTILVAGADEYKWKILAPIAATNAISLVYEGARKRAIEKRGKSRR
jgi:hypothetical protein